LNAIRNHDPSKASRAVPVGLIAIALALAAGIVLAVLAWLL
jgi:hypothetical protein